MNSNMPYDDFVVKQIAGDLLPGATQGDRIATGFLRNSMTNEEGGVKPEQFRIEGIFDRIDAVGKSVLGLTAQCAQCHTHKYDPLTHDEYYGMYAYLNGIEETSIAALLPSAKEETDSLLAEIVSIDREIVEKSLMPRWLLKSGSRKCSPCHAPSGTRSSSISSATRVRSIYRCLINPSSTKATRPLAEPKHFLPLWRFRKSAPRVSN